MVGKIFLSALTLCYLVNVSTVFAATKNQIDRGVQGALEDLYATSPGAKALSESAVAILVFPKIIKGGLVFGGQSGDGALLKKGETVGYYNTSAFSYGFQIGVQSFGYALFFMTVEDLDYLETSDGWEIGAGPTIVAGDSGASGSLSTTTAKKGVQTFFFNQSGLMAGLSIEGAKITKINR